MAWSRLFFLLSAADWSDAEIAEAYGTPKDRVRILIDVETVSA